MIFAGLERPGRSINIKVLIVDDVPSARDLCVEISRSMGLKTATPDSGGRALAVFGERKQCSQARAGLPLLTDPIGASLSGNYLSSLTVKVPIEQVGGRESVTRHV